MKRKIEQKIIDTLIERKEEKNAMQGILYMQRVAGRKISHIAVKVAATVSPQ